MTNRISIHAPREGCDSSSPASKTVSHADFNPRTPRGVRHWESSRDAPACDFNPRTPRGVRRAFDRGRVRAGGISIHAPREGCDAPTASERRTTWTFQSTHPARGATVGDIVVHGRVAISIHAPREGCDRAGAIASALYFYFNPRTPRGVRLPLLCLAQINREFQSTHPARGATSHNL